MFEAMTKKAPNEVKILSAGGLYCVEFAGSRIPFHGL